MHLGFVPYKPRFDFSRSLPNKFVEYLCHSLPIISSLDGCVEDELIKNKIGFSLRNKNFYDDIFYCISNYDNLSNLSFKAFEVATSYFNPYKIYPTMSNFIRNLI